MSPTIYPVQCRRSREARAVRPGIWNQEGDEARGAGTYLVPALVPRLRRSFLERNPIRLMPISANLRSICTSRTRQKLGQPACMPIKSAKRWQSRRYQCSERGYASADGLIPVAWSLYILLKTFLAGSPGLFQSARIVRVGCSRILQHVLRRRERVVFRG